MKLSNRKVTAIIVLITIALGGLITLQTILLRTALKAEEETFRSNIILALNKVVQDISTNEARQAIFEISINDSTGNTLSRIIRNENCLPDSLGDSIFYDFQFDNESDSLPRIIHYQAHIVDENGKVIVIDSTYEGDKVVWTIPDSSDSGNNVRDKHIYKIKSVEDTISLVGNFIRKDSTRIMLIEAALSQLDSREYLPVVKRIDTLQLDSLINLSFEELNIDLDYSFGVTGSQDDSVLLAYGSSDDESLLNSPYRARLFPFDLMPVPNHLVVHFPDKQFYIYSKLGKIILPSGIFLIIIIACFVYSIKTILKQRQTAHRLTDFINNMTHEFKTPISTIQLAVEAVSRDDVLSDNEKIKKLNSMILFENRRMKNHVDKILQIATLEEGDYILKREKVDIHKMIKDVEQSLSIHITRQKGRIIEKLNAGKTEVKGDAVHLMNIIHNLFDNAVKYSPAGPEITVSTENKDNNIIIRISDKGIGIDTGDLKRVFDKYYRVSSGDIHDVKGFGLGLSYVKMMTEAHNGRIELASSLGKGTEVTLIFPTV